MCVYGLVSVRWGYHLALPSYLCIWAGVCEVELPSSTTVLCVYGLVSVRWGYHLALPSYVCIWAGVCEVGLPSSTTVLCVYMGWCL